VPDPPAGRPGRVIVTGGGRGIGLGIVERFVGEGAQVVVLDIDRDGAVAASAHLGPAVTVIGVDLGDAPAVGPAVEGAVAVLGGLDVLVNNAGIFVTAPLAELAVQDWDRLLDVNARAVLLTTQAALPALRCSPAGRIVNIASMAARRGAAGEAGYAASKAAVVGLTRVAAVELGPHGITVNAVCPGYVLTDMGAATRRAEDVARWSAQSPLGRLASVGDVAAVVSFLASADGGYLTGQALDVSGGMVTA
jgi:3-oxoacyl-[acyl-carrier protein] reductase